MGNVKCYYGLRYFNSPFNVQFCIEFTLYALRYMFYHWHSTLYVLPATLFNLRSTFHQLLSLIYALRYTIYPPSPSTLHSLRSTSYSLYALPSKPICLEGYWNFLIFFKIFKFLTKTSEQHKGRLLVVVRFLVYFRRTSSLSETSSGNDLSMLKFNFPWKWTTAETCCTRTLQEMP